MSNSTSPLDSLKNGHWFKLICGASFQDLPAVRSLALVYALAGADCIDVAADPAVISIAQEGLLLAQKIRKSRGFWHKTFPWLMASLNDGEDPHFRKAEFNTQKCPPDCPRPCEKICPAQAINHAGVIEPRCYGCGRCLPVCPLGLIQTHSHVSSPLAIAPLIEAGTIQALEIHTQVGHENAFPKLWQAIAPWTKYLQVLSISCPDHPQLIPYLSALYEQISPLPCPLIWQTDGRPMSGDIGKGTTHAAIKLAQKVLEARLEGYVQLAGGTNDHTVPKLRELGLLNSPKLAQGKIAGIAYGSYARVLLSSFLEPLEILKTEAIAQNSTCLWQAVQQAHQLVNPLKSSTHFCQS